MIVTFTECPILCLWFLFNFLQLQRKLELFGVLQKLGLKNKDLEEVWELVELRIKENVEKENRRQCRSLPLSFFDSKPPAVSRVPNGWNMYLYFIFIFIYLFFWA